MFSLDLLQNDNGFIIWSLNLAIKAIAVLAITMITVWLLRRSSAASRHQIIVIAAVMVILLPVLSLIIPAWNLELISGFQNTATGQTPGYVPGQMATVQGTNEVESWSLSSWLMLIWAVGSAIMLLRMFAGRILGMRTIMNTRQETDQRLNELLYKASDHVGIKKAIMLLVSPAVKVPVIFGSIFPRLILPTKANEWPDERIEAIFIHELSHIKRFDILTQTFAQLVCCLHWFNPLAWVVERRMMIERERACDDMVLIKGKRASEYARHLMESAGALGTARNPAWAMVAMAEGTDFKDRVLSILDPNARRNTPGIALSTIAGLLVALVLVPFAAAQPFSLEPLQQEEYSAPERIIAEEPSEKSPFVEEKDEVAKVGEISANENRGNDQDDDAKGREFAGKMFHGIADLVESDGDPEAGKKFASEFLNSLADVIPDDGDAGTQFSKNMFKNAGKIIENSDNPQMAQKKVADLIRSLGNLTEEAKEELLKDMDKEIKKDTKK